MNGGKAQTVIIEFSKIYLTYFLEEGILSVEEADLKCKEKWDSGKKFHSELGILHGECCPINEGYLVVQDPSNDSNTLCMECAAGLITKPDGSKCQICNDKTGHLNSFCYDEALEALKSQPLTQCFDLGHASEEHIKHCKDMGVQFMNVEEIVNDFSGIKIKIAINGLENLVPTLVDKLLANLKPEDILIVNIQCLKSSDLLKADIKIEIKKDADSIVKLFVNIKPETTDNFRLKLEPVSFNLFGGVLKSITG